MGRTTRTPCCRDHGNPDDTTDNRLGVEDDDLADNATLEARLRRPKPVTLVPSKDWAATLAPAKGSATSTPRARVADELARQTVVVRWHTS
jgi:CRISPR-associated endonuclease/helicase Cas3